MQSSIVYSYAIFFVKSYYIEGHWQAEDIKKVILLINGGGCNISADG